MKRLSKISAAIPFLLFFCGCDKNTEAQLFDNSVSYSSETTLSENTVTALTADSSEAEITTTTITAFDMKYVPEYHGVPYCEINNSLPFFKDEEMAVKSYEYYSPLDDLGRCGECIACIGKDIMPTEKREGIGMVKPSGWQLVRYDGIVNGNYLFNRCHLIGFQLTGENANECNLITGTRYMNEDGMLPFENMTASYVRTTKNHVLYRVTPIFEGKNLLATGVLMEAKSVEDNGAGLQFNVFCYNVQPKIFIDYSTGKNHLAGDESVTAIISSSAKTTAFKNSKTTVTESIKTTADNSEYDYVLNINSRKFHLPDCSSVSDIKEKNRMNYKGSRDELIKEGYVPCKQCAP